jgi:hypothetical protein
VVRTAHVVNCAYIDISGLYNAFLAPGSPCELNIDHALRNSLAGRMTRAVGDEESMLKSLREVVELFEHAQVSVFKLMSSVSTCLQPVRAAALIAISGFCAQIRPGFEVLQRSARTRGRAWLEWQGLFTGSRHSRKADE